MNIILPLAILALSFTTAYGTQTFYQGPNNGLWSDGNNWDGGTVPIASDDAVVGSFIPVRSSDVNVTFNANYSGGALTSLTIDAAGTNGAVIFDQTAAGSSMNAQTEYIGTTTDRAIYNQSNGANAGNVRLGEGVGSSGTYNLSGGTLSGNQTVGVSGAGIFNQTGGTNNGGQVGTLSIGVNSGSVGTYNLSAGSLSVAGAGGMQVGGNNGNGILTDALGTFNQTGGTIVTGGQFYGASTVNINNNGTYNLSAGTLTAAVSLFNDSGAIVNKGKLNLSGGTLTAAGSTGTITNSGAFNISSSPIITGAITNKSGGTVQTAGAAVAFTSTFTNNGAYQSTGGSTQTFTTLTVGTTGSLQGGAGDVFNVGRNLTNNSTLNTVFNLELAQVTLSGSGITHRLAWTGADLGATPAGYQNNFSLGTLELTSNGSLALLDGDSIAGGAVYVHALMLDGGLAQIASISTSGGMNLYYDPNNVANAYLLGQTYPLNGGGFLSPAAVPEPGSLVLAALGVCALGRMMRRK